MSRFAADESDCDSEESGYTEDEESGVGTATLGKRQLKTFNEKWNVVKALKAVEGEEVVDLSEWVKRAEKHDAELQQRFDVAEEVVENEEVEEVVENEEVEEVVENEEVEEVEGVVYDVVGDGYMFSWALSGMRAEAELARAKLKYREVIDLTKDD